MRTESGDNIRKALTVSLIESEQREAPIGQVASDEAGQEPTITNRANLAVFSLSCGTIALGINEFIVLSFIPQIADTYSISVATTAWVTTSFMLGAAVSSPVLATFGAQLDPKHFLMSLQLLLITAAVMSALAPDFAILLLARVLSSISHAAYMGVGSVTAAGLFPESKKGYANARFFRGLSIANLAGIPLCTLLGNYTQWRDAFWPVAGLALISLIGTTSFLPKSKEVVKNNVFKELAIFRKPELWLAFAVSLFGYAGMLASHTYFTEMMINIAGYSESDITWLAALYGAGAVLGNAFGGRMADINLHRSVAFLLTILAGILFAFTFTVHYKIPAAITLFANGFTGFSLITPLMRYTVSQAPEGAGLAAASNVSAFGCGIGLGIVLGGLAISYGYGYQSPNWVGGSLTTLGLVLFLLAEGQKLMALSRNTISNNNDTKSTVESVRGGMFLPASDINLDGSILSSHKKDEEAVVVSPLQSIGFSNNNANL